MFSFHIRLNTYIRGTHGGQLPRWLRFTLLLMSANGVMSGIGLVMVASFQNALLRDMHLAGAGLAFGNGLAFLWFHTLLMFVLRPSPSARWVLILRAVLVGLSTLFFLLFICGDMVPVKVNGTLLTKPHARPFSVRRMAPDSPVSRFLCWSTV